MTDPAGTMSDEQMAATRERIDRIFERVREIGSRLGEELNASTSIAFLRECGLLDQTGAAVRSGFEHLAAVYVFLSKPELIMETAGPFVEAVVSFQAARTEAVAALAELADTNDRAIEVGGREKAVEEREAAVSERELAMDAREDALRVHLGIRAAE